MSLPIWNLLAETGLIALAGVLAFLLRFELDIPPMYRSHLALAIPIWVGAKFLVFQKYRLHRRAWRFFSVDDVMQLAQASTVGSLLCAVIFMMVAPGFPRSIPILDWLLCSLLLAGRHLAGRLIMESGKHETAQEGRKVLIYGAGRAGVALVTELRRNPALGYRVVGFIDDDPRLTEMVVQGATVLGQGRELSAVVTRTGAHDVLIALPSATAEEMQTILQNCQKAQVRFRTVPALAEIVEGKAIAAQIRDVDVQDLLSRAPVELDHRLLQEQIEGRVVMVTGAAGSIGSELCRQLARFHPAKLVAFEIAESPLFFLGREMAESFPDVPFKSEIGNVQDFRRVQDVMHRYRPAIVYHAAAYKHVPLMETSILEAINNNVLGTRNVALAAKEAGVEEFVLISTDKAVRPTSVMGATKRLCELLIRSYAGGSTRFVAVRFGNVLGSNGSVIPLFKQQIANGGPVKVTHPEMRRFFMTIPEASQLVLQASALGEGGEIFVLDMGSQVKILDIARKLILLSGRTPDVDVKIVFTGIRPGEKLYEELNLDDETTVPTSHRKIRTFIGGRSITARMEDYVERLQMLCESGSTHAAILLIQEIVPEYTPSEFALSLPPRKSVALGRTAVLARAATSSVH